MEYNLILMIQKLNSNALGVKILLKLFFSYYFTFETLYNIYEDKC